MAVVGFAGPINQAGVGPSPGTRYATDAYPGFDTEDSLIKPEKKEPKWFAWINGPNCENAEAQMTYCRGLVAEGSYSKAIKQLDALVREWPASEEAPKAQEMMAGLLLEKEQDYEEAFAAYRYLLDFFSLQCRYDDIADKLYRIACTLRIEGKTIMFFRFKNTVDVRRAFEACVLRAPGAKWTPQAMLTIADLRMEEGHEDEAVKVLENLRNVYPNTTEARNAAVKEAEARMKILHDHGYNRERCRDTVGYLKLAVHNCNDGDVEKIRAWIAEASAQMEDEAYRAAKFYDSPTRTARSAINAYERFLTDFPESSHAEEVKLRLMTLKGSK